MARTYSFADLVQLPKLDAMAAQALGVQMLAAAKDKKLPPAADEALGELRSAYSSLKLSAAKRLATEPPVDQARARAADMALDSCWSALFSIAVGWSKVTDPSYSQTATRLIEQLFPDGVRFVLLAYKLEWAESNTRLTVIKEQGLEADIERLGAGPLLAMLRAAHKEYGAVLGLTTIAPTTEAVTSLRETLSAFTSALRQYVVCVAGAVRKKDPKTAELAAALLAPLEGWKTPGTAAPAADMPGGGGNGQNGGGGGDSSGDVDTGPTSQPEPAK